jgi:hypothetical protein
LEVGTPVVGERERLLALELWALGPAFSELGFDLRGEGGATATPHLRRRGSCQRHLFYLLRESDRLGIVFQTTRDRIESGWFEDGECHFDHVDSAGDPNDNWTDRGGRMTDDLPPSLRLAQLAATSPYAEEFGDYLSRAEMFHRITGDDKDATYEALHNSKAWLAAQREWQELPDDEKTKIRDKILAQIEGAARVGGQMTAATFQLLGYERDAIGTDVGDPDVVMIVGAAFWLQGARP